MQPGVFEVIDTEMKARDSGLDWIPLWIDKWLFGSTRIELKPDERSVWVDLMVLSAKDNGFVRANVGMPYPVEQLSGMLCIDVELLLRAVDKCKTVGKIIENEDHTFYLPSWEEYRLSSRHQRRLDEDRCVDKSAKYKSGSPAIKIPSFVKCPKKFDSMRQNNGNVRSSRLLIAIAINRSLTAQEEVHHTDKKENHDQIENLLLFRTHKDHTQFEHGFKIEPEFDGRKLTKNEVAAIMAEFSAIRE